MYTSRGKIIRIWKIQDSLLLMTQADQQPLSWSRTKNETLSNVPPQSKFPSTSRMNLPIIRLPTTIALHILSRNSTQQSHTRPVMLLFLATKKEKTPESRLLQLVAKSTQVRFKGLKSELVVVYTHISKIGREETKVGEDLLRQIKSPQKRKAWVVMKIAKRSRSRLCKATMVMGTKKANFPS